MTVEGWEQEVVFDGMTLKELRRNDGPEDPAEPTHLGTRKQKSSGHTRGLEMFREEAEDTEHFDG